MEAKHTPTPYVLPFAEATDAETIIDACRCKVAIVGSTRIDSEECRKVRAFIVYVCNSHAQLVEACKAALQDLEELGAASSQVSGVLPQLRAALRAAGEEA